MEKPFFFKELSALDALLLCFVKRGLVTAYDLKSRAGMSVGLTRPALERLTKAEMLTSTPGQRESDRYSITAKGEDALQDALSTRRPDRFPWLARVNIFDSAPRALFLTWLYSERDDYLEWSKGEIWKRSRDKADEVKRLLRDIERRLVSLAPRSEVKNEMIVATDGIVVAKMYLLMKTMMEAAMLRAQIEVIKKMTPLLYGMPSVLLPVNDFLKAVKALSKEVDISLNDYY